jgi:hypothetical protein
MIRPSLLFPIALPVALSFLGLAACTSKADDSASAASAVGGPCTAEASEEAKARYTHAIELAIERKTTGEISAWEVANEAGQATLACASFSEQIATSDEAAPIREALNKNLALSVLTGELRLTDATGKYVFEGLQASLARGIDFWGGEFGAYGHTSKIAFGADGKATYSFLRFDEQGDAHWEDVVARYTVGRVLDGMVEIEMVNDEGTTTFELREAKEPIYPAAPSFELMAPRMEAYTSFANEGA